MSATPSTLPRAVLFDWDNTLVDTWGCIHAALSATLMAMGHAPWTEEETRARVRQSLRDSFPRMFGNRWQEARDVFYDTFAAIHIERLRPMAGAETLLTALAGRGVYLGVVSNKTGTFLREEADALGWTRFFGRLVGAADAVRDKPDPAPVLMALEPSGLTPCRDVWFVGDADIDMECAHGAGCLPVFVGPEAEAACDRFPPVHRFDTCDALCTLVRRLGDTISFTTSAGTVGI
ncbi:MAG TPA: HAD family hydrolase [Azospirillaceae bacterium]|nr:HAD family hydrolase [Azospirillaceae bacterium]